MKFNIDTTIQPENRKVLYILDEVSFDTVPGVHEINFDLVLNRLNLTVAEDDNRIVQIWGVCGYKEWREFDGEVPKSQKGILKVVEDLPSGVGSFLISDKEVPMNFNNKTQWLCIGNPENKSNAVEFIENCVAVINDSNEFVALWIKIQLSPSV